MVYRRFGTIFSRLLLSKQDEMRCLEAKLKGVHKTEEYDGNTQYMISRQLDADRNSLPPTFRGESRIQLMEKIEKKSLGSGKRKVILARNTDPDHTQPSFS